MHQSIPLREFLPGDRGEIAGLLPECSIRRRLMDLGFSEGAPIKCLFQSMFGDPTAYEICGTVIALRSLDSASVLVRPSGRENAYGRKA